MRTSLMAGFVAASVVFASINAAPVMAQTDTPDPAASTPAENTGNTENKADGNKDDGAMDANAPADATAALIDTRNAFRELSAATGQDGEGSSLEALDRDPENDPLYIDPEKRCSSASRASRQRGRNRTSLKRGRQIPPSRIRRTRLSCGSRRPRAPR